MSQLAGWWYRLPMPDQSRSSLAALHAAILRTVIALTLLAPAAHLLAQDLRREGAEAVPEVAQDPAPRPQYQERIDVRLVTLPVFARDRNGRPVTDLRASELQVREGNRNYRVASVTPYFDTPEARKDLPHVTLITHVPGGSRDVGKFTGVEPRYLIILIDIENDPPTDRQRAIEEVAKVVERNLDASFRIAVMRYDGDVRLMAPFTQDRATVLDALHRAYKDAPARSMKNLTMRMEDFLEVVTTCAIFEPEPAEMPAPGQVQTLVDKTCLHDSMYEYAGEVTAAASAFISGLEGVIEYAAGLEGHKAVVTVGGNVTLNPAKEAAEAMRAIWGPLAEISQIEQSYQATEMTRPSVERLMALAFEHDVSLSFLDRTFAVSDVSARSGRVLEPGFRPMSTAVQTARQDMGEIAASTGGSFIASTRVENGLQQLLTDMRGGYYVTFHVQDDAPITPRRLRGISVRSSRPGIRIVPRRLADVRGKRDEDSGEELRGRIETGRPVTQAIDGTQGDFIPLRFVLEPKDLGYEENGGRAVTRFTLNVRVRTPDGVVLADNYRVLSHAYPLEVFQRGEMDPVALLAFADLPDGDYVAEAVAFIPRLDKRRTLRTRLTINRQALAAATPADPAPAVPAEAAAAAESSEVPTAAAAAPRAAREAPRATTARPILFASQFLGIVAGMVDVSFATAPTVASVELLIDGQRAGRVEREPWTVRADLGDVPAPKELIAVARDVTGAEIGRVRQRINLPRPWAEIDVALAKERDGRLVAEVTFNSVGGEKPSAVTAALNGKPLALADPSRIPLPGIDLQNVHFLRVEAQFEQAGAVSQELVFGGQHLQEATAELSSIAVQLPGKRQLAAADVSLNAAGTPLTVVALEKGAADVVVVIDPRALQTLPGIAAARRPKAWTLSPAQTAQTDQNLTPGDPSMNLRLLWPVTHSERATGDGAADVTYRLFPSSAPEAGTAGRGLLRHLADATFPAGKGAVRLADAVAVAGTMAVERGRRRVVLLLHGGSPTEGAYTAAAARAYLERLRVPLVVWSPTRPTAETTAEWGEIDLVSTNDGVRRAWEKLSDLLDRQRVLWFQGMHLPQNLEVTGKDVALAGVPQR
jgi:VWFA-related protein